MFQSMIAFRGDVTENGISTGNFILAVNQVFIAFNDNKKVIQAFEKYRQDKTVLSLQTDWRTQVPSIICAKFKKWLKKSARALAGNLYLWVPISRQKQLPVS